MRMPEKPAAKKVLFWLVAAEDVLPYVPAACGIPPNVNLLAVWVVIAPNLKTTLVFTVKILLTKVATLYVFVPEPPSVRSKNVVDDVPLMLWVVPLNVTSPEPLMKEPLFVQLPPTAMPKPLVLNPPDEMVKLFETVMSWPLISPAELELLTVRL